MPKKKILITGGHGMLAYDFIRTQKDRFDIISVDREECDITSFESILQCIALYEPDILLNCAAYTAVDDAEDIGAKMNYEINTLGVYNLAKATSVFGVEFITISTDYVFDGQKKEWYLPTDMPNPINAYGMAKYLGERLAQDINPSTIIVRTSWLYGGNIYGSPHGVYKNFVNTILKFSETRSDLQVVSDQRGIPTSCIDLSYALAVLADTGEQYEGQILHFSSFCEEGSISWARFAREIIHTRKKEIQVIDCASSEYQTKAHRPTWSILRNYSEIVLWDWREGLFEYMGK